MSLVIGDWNGGWDREMWWWGEMWREKFGVKGGCGWSKFSEVNIEFEGPKLAQKTTTVNNGA
jgi:hypothetical protein